VQMTLEEIRYQMNTYEEKREKLALLLIDMRSGFPISIPLVPDGMAGRCSLDWLNQKAAVGYDCLDQIITMPSSSNQT
jgi:hypothetical protein